MGLMTKLIIGCGYLGSRVARLWLEQGDDVSATTRHACGFANAAIKPIVCDVLHPESLHDLPQADTVVYAIGLDRSSGATMRAVYVDGLANVLNALPPPQKFIYISSSSV